MEEVTDCPGGIGRGVLDSVRGFGQRSLSLFFLGKMRVSFPPAGAANPAGLGKFTKPPCSDMDTVKTLSKEEVDTLA